MSIYMKYGDVKGQVTTKAYEDWIELSSFQWGCGRAISSPHGSSAKREASIPSISEISVTKELDAASNALLEAALHGLPVKTEIAFTRTKGGGDGVEEYLRYELTGTLPGGYSISSGGERPTESMSLNFTKVMVKNSSPKADQTGNPLVTTYDLATTGKA